jgi:hypothetical protein
MTPDGPRELPLVVHRSPGPRLERGVELAYFSLITTIGTPQDVTLQEIRLESFFPADDATEAHRWQRR